LGVDETDSILLLAMKRERELRDKRARLDEQYQLLIASLLAVCPNHIN
jgi:hypothetical protein